MITRSFSDFHDLHVLSIFYIYGYFSSMEIYSLRIPRSSVSRFISRARIILAHIFLHRFVAFLNSFLAFLCDIPLTFLVIGVIIDPFH